MSLLKITYVHESILWLLVKTGTMHIWETIELRVREMI